MVWFKVDDNLSHHPKALKAGNAALGLWVRAGAWSMSNLTNGFIPRSIATQMGTESQINRLQIAGLWLEVDGGYSFHDWEERQPDKTEVETKRAANRKRQAEHRERRRAEGARNGVTNGVTEGSRNGVTDSVTNGVTSGRRNAVTNGTPSRPDPTQLKEGGYVTGELTTREHNEPEPPPRFARPANTPPAAAAPAPGHCPDHPNGTDAPCRRCADTRKHAETAAATEREAHARAAHEARQAQREADAAIRLTAINNCSICDDNGKHASGMPCDHVARTIVPGRGRALLEALNAKPTTESEPA